MTIRSPRPSQAGPAAGHARRLGEESVPPPLTGWKAGVYNAADSFGSFLLKLFTKAGNFLTRNISDRINAFFHVRPQDLYPDGSEDQRAKPPLVAADPAAQRFAQRSGPEIGFSGGAPRLPMLTYRPPKSPFDGLEH